MKVKLSDICLITSSKRIFEREYVKTGVPFIRGQEVSDGSIEDSNSTFECYISKERYNELKEKYIIPKKNDILITAVGTIGNLYYVDNDFEFYFKDGNLILFTNFSEMVYPKYLYYFMKSPYFKKQIEYSMIGAVQKALTMVMLSKIEIDLPSYNEQVKIANIFSKLDNKIKNNKNINSELESMAKTIYDYWFLQYEFPNEEGKPYKSSGGKMVYNDELKKEIPEGWKVNKAGEVISVVRGISYKPKDEIKEINKDTISLLKSNNIQNGSINFEQPVYLDKKMANEEQWLTKGSVFITMSSGSKAHMGKTAIVYETLPYVYGAFCAKINIKPSHCGFISTYFRSSHFRTYIENVTLGTSINNISNDQLTNIKLAFPEERVLEKFEKIIKPIFEKQGKIIFENQELTKLRDELLPLLMNGQVGFKE